MAKRTSLKERKGVDVLFDSSPHIESNKEIIQTTQTGNEKKALPKESTNKDYNVSKDPNLVRMTIFIRNDQMIDLEQIQVDERRRTGVKPDKYILAQEAYDLLIQKYKK